MTNSSAPRALNTPLSTFSPERIRPRWYGAREDKKES